MTTPLTDKAIEKLRDMVEGNGIDPKKVELLGTEETQITLRGEMLLSLDVVSSRKKFPGPAHPRKNAQTVPSVADIATRVETLKTTLLGDSAWTKSTIEQLKAAPGQGIGIEKAEITLDDLAQTFMATESCPTCFGKGHGDCKDCHALGHMPCKTCNATGEELCYQCQGTGKNPMAQPRPCAPCNGRGQVQINVNQSCPQCHGSGRDNMHPEQSCHVCHGRGQVQGHQSQTCQACFGRGVIQPSAHDLICPICSGHMRIQCRACLGKREITCPTCRGSKTVKCQSCEGQGKFTVEEEALPIARSEFHVIGSSDLPSTLRHALDRGGMKMLIKLNAKITMEASEERESKQVVVPYSAQFPFADLRLRINGKPMKAGVMGEKASIRDIPPFFDPVFDEELKKFEKNAGASGTIKKALKLRAMRDLFAAMQAGGDVVLNFRRRYPYGFSVTMIERMVVGLKKLVQASTLVPRLSASAFLLFVLSGLFVAVIGSGVRQTLALLFTPPAAFVLDGAVCIIAFVAVQIVLQLAAALHVTSLSDRRLGLNLGAQRAGSLGIAVGICAVLIYLGLLWFLKATPGFIG